MAEYILKQDATKVICEWGTRQERIGRYAVTMHELKQNTADMLDELPSADVVPVVHGKWIKYTGMGKVQWMCSECSAEEKNPKVANYCYHCGAKMDGERKE